MSVGVLISSPGVLITPKDPPNCGYNDVSLQMWKYGGKGAGPSDIYQEFSNCTRVIGEKLHSIRSMKLLQDVIKKIRNMHK